MSYLRSIGAELPPIALNASDMAHAGNTPSVVGAIAIFYYPRSGLYHVAEVVGFSKKGNEIIKEANYHKCEADVREVDPSDSTILGYWTPMPFAYNFTGINGV